jgi:hypothetical protein
LIVPRFRAWQRVRPGIAASSFAPLFPERIPEQQIKVHMGDH